MEKFNSRIPWIVGIVSFCVLFATDIIIRWMRTVHLWPLNAIDSQRVIILFVLLILLSVLMLLASVRINKSWQFRVLVFSTTFLFFGANGIWEILHSR